MKKITLSFLLFFVYILVHAQCSGTKTLTSANYTGTNQSTIDGWFNDNNKIVVPNGVTVSIKSCSLKVRLRSTSIEVSTGGRLILIDCELKLGSQKTSCSFGPSFNGLIVHGTPGAGQYVSRQQPYDPSDEVAFTDVSRYNTQQGVLIMSGCTIHSMGVPDNNIYASVQSLDGGCLEMYNCHFINNYQCIKISNYKSTSGDLAEYNAFNIINCTFETELTATQSDIGSYYIGLTSVNRVQIEGCYFLNNLAFTSGNNTTARNVNRGIDYDDASFSLQRSGFNRMQSDLQTETNCPKYNLGFARNNKFSQLPYAIFSSGSNGMSNQPFVVADCEITDCLGGIYISKAMGGTIARNTYTFNENTSYEGFLLNIMEKYRNTSYTQRDQIYFMRIAGSEQITISENKGDIMEDDFKVSSTVNINIIAFFVAIEDIKDITKNTHQIQIYRNCDRGYTNYLGNNVDGGFRCSGSRTTSQQTYGVAIGKTSATEYYLSINCNDFEGISNPIHFTYGGSKTLNSGYYLENDGKKATMNIFTSCSNPAVISPNQIIYYRYLSGASGHDPGSVGGQVTKDSTTSDYDCNGLPCEELSWGNGTGIDEVKMEESSIQVYPNPNNGSFKISWPRKENYFGVYHITLYNTMGQRLYETVTNENSVEICINSLNIANMIIGSLSTENEEHRFKIQIY
ncbi:hypothetical protein GC194_12440 [bacterium]|nr:hypothetical protein [bacterium]